MNSLHDQLTDLAGTVDVPPLESDLWIRGRRLQRRRRTTQAIIAATAAVAIAIGLGASFQARTAQAPVVSAEAGLRLPERLWAPSIWLPGTDDEGPIGPLVAVMGAERGTWTGSERGLVGVSGTTGTYRFIDLPLHRAVDADPEVALSPDGRYLAYWTTDGTTDPANEPVVTGIAIHDTVSGEDVRERYFSAPHGAMPQGFIWTDDALWIDYFEYVDDARDTAGGHHALTLSTETLEWADAPFAPELTQASTSGSNLLTAGNGPNVRLSRAQGSPEPHRLDRLIEQPRLGPGDRIAGLADVDGASVLTADPLPLVVGTLVEGRTTALRRVPGVEAHEVAGWRDADTVVVRTSVVSEEGGDLSAYQAVDVVTGDASVLTIDDTRAGVSRLQVARDGWAAPTYDAPEPPTPWSPRVVTGALTLTVVIGIAIVGWRRRVRP